MKNSTPMYQVLHHALADKDNKTRFTLIFANVSPSDILLKEELDREAAKNPDKFSVHYFLNEPPQGWTGGTGFVSKEAIQEKLPAPANDIKVLMCGESETDKALASQAPLKRQNCD